MSWLSKAFDKAAPIVATVGPYLGAPGQAAALAARVEMADDARKQQKDMEIERDRQIKMRRAQMAEIFGTGQVSGIQRPVNVPATQNAGFFDTIGSGLTSFFNNAGSVIRGFGQSGIPQLLGMNRTLSSAQQPAVTTTRTLGAMETQGSGSIQAGFGNVLTPALGIARNLLRSPGGQVAIGGGAALLGMSGGGSSTKRITRKMKSQARTVLNMVGGDLNAAADILNISVDELVFVLLKRFRNDGPMVTKAAIRKTRSTIRKLHMMKGILDDVSRKTPTRRRSSATFSRRGTLTSKV